MPQELTIRTVLNGWIIQAGCQTVVFTDPSVFADEFRDWLKEPAKVEDRYRRLMEKKGMGPPAQPAQVEATRPFPVQEIATMPPAQEGLRR